MGEMFTHSANLPRIRHDPLSSFADRGSHICIFENETGALSAALQTDSLEVALGCILCNSLSSRGASSKGDLPDLHMRGEELADLSSSIDNVDDSRWETLCRDLCQGQGA